MIHIQIKLALDNIIDLYYPIEKIEVLKITTDKYNMKSIIMNNISMYDNVCDVIVEEV